MLNFLLDSSHLSLVMLFAFFLFFTIRTLFIKRLFVIGLYHVCLFVILFIAVVGGGGVQNDGYDRLKKFKHLEEMGQLEEARKNFQSTSPMLQIDLTEFKNSADFLTYLKENDLHVDRAEAVAIGWIFCLIAELSLAFSALIGWVISKRKKK